MDAPWRVTLLGGLRLEQGERSITRFYTYKYGALLAYLAYYRDRAHSREALIEMFWPDSDLKAGRNSLSVALSSLRHQLEPPGTPANTVLRADRFSVGVNPAVVTTDAADFEEAVQAVAKAPGAAERIQHLTRAVEGYSGRLLPGHYEEWIAGEQERLAGLFFDAVGKLVVSLEAAGDLAAALGHARHAAAVDPLREEGQAHLIRLLTAGGQPGAALRQYKEFERRLDDELGDEPSAALRALARRIEKETGLVAPIPPSPAPSRPRAVVFTDAAPTTMTFLLTDIEGSTRLWERAGEAFRQALETHHALLRAEFARFQGQEIKEAGDSFLVAFAGAGKALACAVAVQQALADQPWPADEAGQALPLRVRMALHTGDAERRDGEYHGLVLHRASRMLSAAHGGQILASEATAAVVRRDTGEDIRLLDLGVYRLRDVATPERLFQVEYPGGAPTAFPALRAEVGFPSNLPLQFTRFFGREREIGALRELLVGTTEDTESTEKTETTPSVSSVPSVVNPSRLVTLTGPGGTGKTRLALQVAERLVEPFAGSVSLADLSDPNLIAGTILDGLRLTRSPQREPLDQVVEALAKQPSLLVLDNFEHLIGGASATGLVEGGAPIVQTLLSRVPTLTLLVTSRQLLGLSGEREFALKPLPTPNGSDTPERLSAFDSVRLFLDRAQAARPDFQITNHNAPAIAELCDRLEGIPLALELAAARAQVLTPTQMLAQLERRFDFLSSRKRDAGERQRTLKGAIDWSYRLLAPELQRFFCRLSVFRGGWTSEAAEAVCEEPLALDYLAQLRDSSIVLAEARGDDIRFSLLETLREYADERLSTEKRDALQRQYAEYFLALAEQSRGYLQGPEQAVWLDRLETEQDNLRAALRRSLDTDERQDDALRLASALSRFWEVRGHWTEGRGFLSEALSHFPEHTQARGMALNALGRLANALGDGSIARASFEEALAILRSVGDERAAAASLNGLGAIARVEGDYPLAQSHFLEALEIQRRLGNTIGIAGVLGNLLIVAAVQSDYASARRFGEESLVLYREVGDQKGIADNLNNLALVATSQSDFPAARRLLEESLLLHEALGNKEGRSENLMALGALAEEQSDYDAARRFYATALDLCDELKDRSGQAVILHNLGNVACDEADFAQAKELYERSLALVRELGDKEGIAETLHMLGKTVMHLGEDARGRALIEQSLELYQELEGNPGTATVLNSLGELAAREGDFAAAFACCAESLGQRSRCGDRRGVASCLEGLAAVAHGQGRPERAARLLGAAAVLREAIQAPLSPSGRGAYETRLAAVRQALGEPAFVAAWESGRVLTWEEAVAYALEEANG